MFAAKPPMASPVSGSNAAERPIPGISPRPTPRKLCVRTLPLPRRPKVPLLSGSVLVLLTLFLPVAYSQCGTARWSGGDYLLGFGAWPGSMGALSYAAGRVPYFVTLLLAAVTLLLLMAAQVRPSLLHQSELTARLFMAAGTLSLFMIGDFFGFQLGSRIGDFLKPTWTPSGQNLLMMVAVSTIAVTVICLRSRLLRSQRWMVWLFAVAGGISAFTVVNYFLVLFGALPIIPFDWAFVIAISPSFLYFVIPLGLWCHFGLSRRADLQRQWPGIRRRIALLYLPAVLFDLIVLGLEMRPGWLWGLLPYFGGLGLIFWGYAAFEGRPAFIAEEGQASGLKPAVADHAGVNVG